MFCVLGRHAFGGGFMGFMMLFWLILIVAVIYLLFRRTGGNFSHSGGNSEALEILKMRYAKGEITEEEYVSRKNILTKK
jgi:putative membrane protein